MSTPLRRSFRSGIPTRSPVPQSFSPVCVEQNSSNDVPYLPRRKRRGDSTLRPTHRRTTNRPIVLDSEYSRAAKTSELRLVDDDDETDVENLEPNVKRKKRRKHTQQKELQNIASAQEIISVSDADESEHREQSLTSTLETEAINNGVVAQASQKDDHFTSKFFFSLKNEAPKGRGTESIQQFEYIAELARQICQQYEAQHDDELRREITMFRKQLMSQLNVVTLALVENRMLVAGVRKARTELTHTRAEMLLVKQERQEIKVKLLTAREEVKTATHQLACIDDGSKFLTDLKCFGDIAKRDAKLRSKPYEPQEFNTIANIDWSAQHALDYLARTRKQR